ncbi:hypothetical protein ACFQX6_67185 [Streptosporangium lutulentum]
MRLITRSTLAVASLAACTLALLTTGTAHAALSAPTGEGCWVSWPQGSFGRYEARTQLLDGQTGRNQADRVTCSNGHYVNVQKNYYPGNPPW